MNDESGLVLWGIICAIAILLLICFVVSQADEAACAARGGHQVTKYIYKGTLTLCISADGRILE